MADLELSSPSKRLERIASDARPSTRRAIWMIVVGLSLVLVGLNLTTALRGTSPRPQHKPVTNETLSRYSELVLAKAFTREAHKSAADRVDAQIKAAQAVVARMDQAARAAQEALASLGERTVDELSVCSVVDTYRRRQRRNETVCVAPAVQVERKVRVRLVPKGEKGGKRAFFLLTQGLRQHPMVELVGSRPKFCDDKGYEFENDCERDTARIGERTPADLVVLAMPANDPKAWDTGRLLAYSPYRWDDNKKLAQDPVISVGDKRPASHADENPTLFRYSLPRNKVLLVDESDWAGRHPHVVPPYLAYFKRSWVEKADSVPTKAAAHHPNFFPMPYALADQYLSSDVSKPRDLDVVCSLRDTRGGRGRVVRWLKARYKSNPAVIVGEVSGAGRTTIDAAYLAAMRRAKIVVTCNPTHWEGDFRLFEAFASAALVLVDTMATPYHHPLVDGVHVVYYDNTNSSDLLSKIDHALAHPRWARTIALRGYMHVLRHHRAVSWVDYFLRTSLLALHAVSSSRRDADAHTPDDDGGASTPSLRSRKPAYTETGQALLDRVGASAVVSQRDHGARVLSNVDLSNDDAALQLPPPSLL